jgi:hypothetical protein
VVVLADAVSRYPITGIAGCCARAASGQAAAEPTIPLMQSRRRIAFPKAGTTPTIKELQQGFTTGGMGSGVSLQGTNPKPLMSALGQKATSIAGGGVRFTPSGHSESAALGLNIHPALLHLRHNL